jgi:hypothetical protein
MKEISAVCLEMDALKQSLEFRSNYISTDDLNSFPLEYRMSVTSQHDDSLTIASTYALLVRQFEESVCRLRDTTRVKTPKLNI